MKASIKAALLAVTLALAVPAAPILSVSPVSSAWAAEDKSAEQLARLALEQMLKAFEQLLRSIPQYAMPEILDNGDIIIRRIHPRGDRGDDDDGKGGKKAKPADPHKLEETRA